jgi:hypothetical protein
MTAESSMNPPDIPGADPDPVVMRAQLRRGNALARAMWERRGLKLDPRIAEARAAQERKADV